MGELHNEHKPSEKSRLLVSALSAYNVPQSAICHSLAYFCDMSIERHTLKKHYAKELKTKQDFGKSLALSTLFLGMMKGETAAAIFYLKTQCGWRESIGLDLNMILPDLDLIPSDQTGQIIEAELVKIPGCPVVGN